MYTSHQQKTRVAGRIGFRDPPLQTATLPTFWALNRAYPTTHATLPLTPPRPRPRAPTARPRRPTVSARDGLEAAVAARRRRHGRRRARGRGGAHAAVAGHILLERGADLGRERGLVEVGARAGVGERFEAVRRMRRGLAGLGGEDVVAVSAAVDPAVRGRRAGVGLEGSGRGGEHWRE